MRSLRLELATTAYRAGDELSGVFVIDGGLPAGAYSIELSVLWHTSGKGTEDMGVVHFRGWKQNDAMPNPNTFSMKLPLTPWSYDGELIKIHWLVRVRMRFGLPDAPKELVEDAPFTLAPRTR